MPPIAQHRIKSDDAEIVYWTLGDGPAVFLLHPFPANHQFWLPVAETLSTRYRIVLPDLRGHGESTAGEGPATMQKLAADLARLMDADDIGRAPIIGVSIGGYLLFEFWRRSRNRVAALGLCNTKAGADGPEARAGRLQAANDVLERGTADRPDSIDTLKTINVPALLITGNEDMTTGVNEAELMRQQISGSQLRVIPKAGHYSPWEQPQEAARLLRQFLDAIRTYSP